MGANHEMLERSPHTKQATANSQFGTTTGSSSRVSVERLGREWWQEKGDGRQQQISGLLALHLCGVLLEEFQACGQTCAGLSSRPSLNQSGSGGNIGHLQQIGKIQVSRRKTTPATTDTPQARKHTINLDATNVIADENILWQL